MEQNKTTGALPHRVVVPDTGEANEALLAVGVGVAAVVAVARRRRIVNVVVRVVCTELGEQFVDTCTLLALLLQDRSLRTQEPRLLGLCWAEWRGADTHALLAGRRRRRLSWLMA